MIYIPKPRLGIQLNRKHPLAKGLVGCWVMNEATGDKVFDLSGNSNHGTLINNATWATTEKGIGTIFPTDTGSDRIDLGSIAGDSQLGGGLTGELTVVTRVYKVADGDSNNGYQRVVDKSTAGGGADGYSIWWDTASNTYKFYINGGLAIDSTAQADEAVWHDIAITYSELVASARKMYINGLDVTSSTAARTFSSNSANMAIGNWNIGTDRQWCGDIVFVYIYYRALTTGEIAWLYREPYAMFQPEISPQLYTFFDESITLTVAALDGAGLLDNVALTQKHTLAVQALSGTGVINNVVLTQKHLLALQGLLSSGVLDAVALTQKHILSVQELSGAGTLDNVVLTQKHILAVQELLSAGTLDNIELSISTLLVVADLLSSGALDNVGLTQKHILTVDEILSAGQLDGVALTQKNLLAINDLISSGIIDNISFDVAAGLICITLTQSTEYNINLTQGTEYNIILTQTGGGVC